MAEGAAWVVAVRADAGPLAARLNLSLAVRLARAAVVPLAWASGRQQAWAAWGYQECLLTLLRAAVGPGQPEQPGEA